MVNSTTHRQERPGSEVRGCQKKDEVREEREQAKGKLRQSERKCKSMEEKVESRTVIPMIHVCCYPGSTGGWVASIRHIWR